jgi:mannose-6-phosphate isomerase-like protein (cupin superfamily)
MIDRQDARDAEWSHRISGESILSRTAPRKTEYYQVKACTALSRVNPGACLSLREHFQRSEHWVLRRVAELPIGEDVKLCYASESAHVPIGAIHNLRIEVQVGSYLGEDERCGSGTSAAGTAKPRYDKLLSGVLGCALGGLVKATWPFTLSELAFEPSTSGRDPLLEPDAGLPAEGGEAADVEELARRAVGARGVQRDLASR